LPQQVKFIEASPLSGCYQKMLAPQIGLSWGRKWL
jgi:hypothetical protein